MPTSSWDDAGECAANARGWAIDPAELERLDHTVAELDHGDGAAVVLLQPWQAPPFVEFLDDAVDHDLAVVDEPPVGRMLESRNGHFLT